ncbi:MAG: Uma2 family endonuclease [Thermomicrobiales bacterium]
MVTAEKTATALEQPALEQPVIERPLMWDDLESTPESGERYEIFHGEMVVSASPTPPHSRVSTRLASALERHVEATHSGVVFGTPVDVQLTLYDILGPHVCFVSTARLHIIGPTFLTGAPDLVVEVFSPSTRRRDLVQKAALYAAAGVPEYWQVDPVAKGVRVLELMDGLYVAVVSKGVNVPSRVLPKLKLSIASLFAGLD